MGGEHYDAILDIYPLVSEIERYAPLLASRIEKCAFRVLNNKDQKTNGEEIEADLKNLLLSLKIARDLGYVDNRVFLFFRNKLGNKLELDKSF